MLHKFIHLLSIYEKIAAICFISMGQNAVLQQQIKNQNNKLKLEIKIEHENKRKN